MNKKCSYEGEFKNDLKEGLGMYIWASGNYYKGYYKGDLRDGYGEMYWADHSHYKGNWHLGLQHGYGILIDQTTGEVKKGLFEQGKFICECTEEEVLTGKYKQLD